MRRIKELGCAVMRRCCWDGDGVNKVGPVSVSGCRNEQTRCYLDGEGETKLGQGADYAAVLFLYLTLLLRWEWR